MTPRIAPGPRCGFTLTEMVVVIGILMLLMGLAMPAMMMSMRRADANSTQNVIATVHQSQVRNARQVGGSGTVYGFSLIYKKISSAMGKIPTNTYCATSIIPWYVSPRYISGTYTTPPNIGYTSASDLAQAIGGGIITGTTCGITDGTNSLYDIDFVDTVVPAVSINSVVFPSTKTTKTLTTTMTTLHVAYEPGTGFVHAALNATETGSASALTSSNSLTAGDIDLHLPNKLRTYTPNQVEIVLYSIANGAPVNRVILYQNGTYAIVGPQ